MKDVQITEPSYDFQYKFESIEKDRAMQVNTRTHVAGEYTYALMAHVNASSTTTTKTGMTMHAHHIRVEINMDTYYASVDEAKTKISDSASNLLTNNDIPGFFNSCGSYYIRSLGRNARFLSIFTYKTASTESDVAFENSLAVAIKGFSPHSGSSTVEQSTQVGVQASQRELTITTMAWGLGKNEGATLISYDLETFKAAIKDAFISMQNPMTGKVRTMEVVPWVENTDFQDLIKLEEEVDDPATGKKMLLYKKKHILNLNSEFLAEIERADRNMMNIYYKAKICRQYIDGNWKMNDKFMPGMEEAKLLNLRTGATNVTLKQLDTALTPEVINQLLTDEDKFMYGPDGGQACMQELLESGMFKKSWRDIDTCKKLRSKLTARINEMIDDHCMPIIAPPEPKK